MPTSASKARRDLDVEAAVQNTTKSPPVVPKASPIEEWLRFRADLFKASEPVLVGWVERRCAGVTAVLDSLSKLAFCHDLDSAVTVHSAWLEASTQRLNSDIHAIAEHTLAVSRCTANATERAARTTSEMITQGAGWVVSGVSQVDETAAAEPEAGWDGHERRSPSRPWSKEVKAE